jgi:hypothetical protein
MPDNKDKAFWKTVLKLALGAIALILFFGLGLYFTAKFDSYAPPDTPSAPDWGISKDSPIFQRR